MVEEEEKEAPKAIRQTHRKQKHRPAQGQPKEDDVDEDVRAAKPLEELQKQNAELEQLVELQRRNAVLEEQVKTVKSKHHTSPFV